MTHSSQVSVTRLFEKTSSKGNRYFVGRLGNARVLLFRDERSDMEGDPVWQMYLTDGAKTPTGGSGTRDTASEGT